MNDDDLGRTVLLAVEFKEPPMVAFCKTDPGDTVFDLVKAASIICNEAEGHEVKLMLTFPAALTDQMQDGYREVSSSLSPVQDVIARSGGARFVDLAPPHDEC